MGAEKSPYLFAEKSPYLFRRRVLTSLQRRPLTSFEDGAASWLPTAAPHLVCRRHNLQVFRENIRCLCGRETCLLAKRLKSCMMASWDTHQVQKRLKKCMMMRLIEK